MQHYVPLINAQAESGDPEGTPCGARPPPSPTACTPPPPLAPLHLYLHLYRRSHGAPAQPGLLLNPLAAQIAPSARQPSTARARLASHDPASHAAPTDSTALPHPAPHPPPPSPPPPAVAFELLDELRLQGDFPYSMLGVCHTVVAVSAPALACRGAPPPCPPIPDCRPLTACPASSPQRARLCRPHHPAGAVAGGTDPGAGQVPSAAHEGGRAPAPACSHSG